MIDEKALDRVMWWEPIIVLTAARHGVDSPQVRRLVVMSHGAIVDAYRRELSNGGENAVTDA